MPKKFYETDPWSFLICFSIDKIKLGSSCFFCRGKLTENHFRNDISFSGGCSLDPSGINL